jgi:hypothetical protein
VTTPRQPVTRQVRTLDVPLGPGRQTLRLILHRDGNGDPEALTLALGYGGGSGPDPFTRPPGAIRSYSSPPT